MIVALLFLFLPLLMSCSTTEPQPVKIQTIYVRIPEPLLNDCRYPSFSGGSWGDVAIYARKLQEIINGCHRQVEKQRKYNNQLGSAK